MQRRAVLSGLALVALASVAGCDVVVTGAPTAAPTHRSRPTAPTSPTSTTPPAPSPGAAANGTDLDACQQGSCEVFVTGTVTIPLDPKFGFTAYTVTCQPPDETQIYGVDPVNGNLHATLDGTGNLAADDITMTVESVDAAGEILKFAPRGN